MSESYRVVDVFTPTTPAKLTFVERSDVNDQLVDAIRTPGKQIVVYGHTGSGKTTLLRNKLEQLYGDWIKSSCTIDTTLDSLILEAFDHLNVYFVDGKSNSQTRSITTSLKADYTILKSSISAKLTSGMSSDEKRFVPPQLTPQRLAHFMGTAGCAWVIDDFHKVRETEKVRLAQTMKVFMDAAGDFNELKVIMIGAVGTAREVIEYDAEMQNRVTEVHVPLMGPDELREIADRGETLLNVEFGRHFKDSVAQYSSGLASIYHQLCLNACFAADINSTQPDRVQLTSEHMTKAISRYLADSSDTLKRAFQLALRQKKSSKWDNCKSIVQTLSSFGGEGATHHQLLEKLLALHDDYPSGNLTHFLKQLQSVDRGELIRLDRNSLHYSFTNPIYHSYAKLIDHKPRPSTKQRLLFDQSTEVRKIIEKALEALKEADRLVVGAGQGEESGGSSP